MYVKSCSCFKQTNQNTQAIKFQLFVIFVLTLTRERSRIINTKTQVTNITFTWSILALQKFVHSKQLCLSDRKLTVHQLYLTRTRSLGQIDLF